MHRWIWLVLCAAACTSARGDASRTEPTGFAVLELFTSEGCSSCPPADALLGAIAREAAQSGLPVYALSFHVDYWDGLGWRDPFSFADASRRQRAYAAVLDDHRVYTPELVLNGRRAFVGSNAAAARSGIRQALAQPAKHRLQLSAHVEGSALAVEVEVSGQLPAQAAVQLAIVQAATTSRVTRGENIGRELQHTNVVRAFQTLPLTGRDRTRTLLPLPAADGELRLIGYVQELPSSTVLAAARTPSFAAQR
ncbi:MAG TPA: DUF1223 domain-containing protein [Polyangiales bacterium]|nr:DUF1223 domain-containing protein [Polyangiales bacterium]